MKLKISALVTAVVMLMSSLASASYLDVDTNSEIGMAIEQLSKLGIINGFEDGTFRPSETLTRAQFAKIAVHMMDEKENAMARATGMVFGDVPSTHWASGYINYIAEKAIINGYPDGNFGAEDTITYAQALTILIRLLGYSGEDMNYKWPDGYIAKAKAIGITEGITFGTYDNVPRDIAAYLVYKTLTVDEEKLSQGSQQSGQSSQGQNQTQNSLQGTAQPSQGSSSNSLVGITLVEDVVVYSDHEMNKNVARGYILTTEGLYELTDDYKIDNSLYGLKGTLYLNDEGEVWFFVAENESVREITVVNASKNNVSGDIEIMYTEGDKSGTESFETDCTVIDNGNITTLEGVMSELESGRQIRLFVSQNGKVERMWLEESTLSGPVTIESDYNQIYSSFNITAGETVSVIRDGRKTAVEELQKYDVVYYTSSNKTVYAYSEKISGTYEEAYPIKANVTSVLINGKEYQLSTQTAIMKMNESENSFDLGDRVTLLFGRNDEVVDVISMEDSAESVDVVVLLNCYSEISDEPNTKGETKHFVTVMTADGKEVIYEVEDDYQEYVGDVMTVDYDGEFAKLSVVKHVPIYGEFDKTIPSLGGNWLTKNCQILEFVSENDENGAVVRKVELEDIEVKKLLKTQVIHAETIGDMKDISFLYIKDVTKIDSLFGVVTAVSGNRYTVMTEEGEKTIQTATKLEKAKALEITETENGQISTPLIVVGSGDSVTGYSNGRIRVGNQTCMLSEYVKIYGGKYASEFESMSLAELVTNKNVKMVTLYADKTIEDGGIVRVIVVLTQE